MIPFPDQYTRHLEAQLREKDAKIVALERSLADAQRCLAVLKTIIEQNEGGSTTSKRLSKDLWRDEPAKSG